MRGAGSSKAVAELFTAVRLAPRSLARGVAVMGIVKRRGFGFDPLAAPHGSKQPLKQRRAKDSSTANIIAQLDEQWRDYRFLKPARQGNWRVLADHLRQEFSPTPAMEQFIVDVLAGKIKRKKGRPREIERNLEIGGYVDMREREDAHDPVAHVAKTFGITKRAAQIAHNAYKKWQAQNVCQPGPLRIKRATAAKRRK
jgi:hypothetical protein